MVEPNSVGQLVKLEHFEKKEKIEKKLDDKGTTVNPNKE